MTCVTTAHRRESVMPNPDNPPPGGGWRCDGCTEQGRDVIVLVAKVKDMWRPDAIARLDWRLSGGTTRTEDAP